MASASCHSALLKIQAPFASGPSKRLSQCQQMFRSTLLDSRKYGPMTCTRAMVSPDFFHQGLDIASNFSLSLGDLVADVSAQDAAANALSSAVSSAPAISPEAVDTTVEFVKQQDWLSGFADILEGVLKGIEGALVALHVPYAYGFSIIILTLLVKIATFPATKTQVESSLAMQELQPKIKAIQEKYANDKERLGVETQRLYQQAGVNPLAGCIPALATIPVFLGLYRTLTNVAGEGELTEGFFWIPSLAGPTSLSARAGGSGLSWLVPFVDGHPPLGWGLTVAYLVLPLLLIVSQYLSMKTLQPSNAQQGGQSSTPPWLLAFLPFLTAFFSLSVPSGLSLYWFVNNVFSTAQQVYLRKMGGAKNESKASDIIDVGRAKRSAAPIVATAAEKEVDRKRAEQFKALKEREEAKKAAARRAAEQAAKASSAAADEGSARLSVTAEAVEVPATEEEEEEEGAPTPEKSNGVVQPGSRRSKRSKRTKRAA